MMRSPTKKTRFHLRTITAILLLSIIVLILVYGIPVLANADVWFLQFIKSLLLITALILGLAEIRRLNSRLAHLSRVAGRLGKGKYDARADVQGTDSVALVGQALNKMAEQIEANINELENSHRELATSQEKLAQQNQELTESYERQARFGEFLVKLNSIDTKKLTQKSFDDLVTAAKAQVGVLFLFNEESQQLEHLVETGIDRAALRKLLPEKSFEGLPGEAFSRREWIVIEDLDENILPELHLGFAKIRIQTVYAIPLLFHNKALGVIVLGSFHKATKATEQTLENYTRALAQALNNALAHQAVQQQTLRWEAANSQLLDMDKHRRRFVANMSHELRTPLNSIIGFSNILLKNRDQTISPPNLDRLEKINRNGKNLLQLINDILDLSKVESGYMEADFSSVNLNALIREVADMLQPQAQAKRIEIALHLPNSPIVIKSDLQKLRQILINLTNNAVKFTDSGTVTLRLSPATEENGPIIEISDTGIGISGDQLEYIFEAFRQADSSTSRVYGGTGLGLAISQSLITLLNGKIRVNSIPGEGSTFTIELPMEPDSLPIEELDLPTASVDKEAATESV
ncbi:MAG TPA: ATP-binding protein [Opitutales bacterium]|nr:ATP-binding protein [Opitutales bacterium]